MTRAGLAAMLLLNACTTPQVMRTHGRAFFTGATKKAPQTAGGCVAAAWGKAAQFQVRTSDFTGRFSVILSSGSATGSDMVADFASDGTVTMNVGPFAWVKSMTASEISSSLVFNVRVWLRPGLIPV
jgi:hypothetical protein